ncbi:hypothetical protein GH714_044129 [Hevea brasiliensis]|uniref:Uncharacterized protein n=1 Tax=Hevea brasiliensis TaxID=3981 RepID=A0A6A6K1F1_HEVBR|nr:hypothetical protein GH714_044129 [Hevea brasiliensis]
MADTASLIARVKPMAQTRQPSNWTTLQRLPGVRDKASDSLGKTTATAQPKLKGFAPARSRSATRYRIDCPDTRWYICFRCAWPARKSAGRGRWPRRRGYRRHNPLGAAVGARWPAGQEQANRFYEDAADKYGLNREEVVKLTNAQIELKKAQTPENAQRLLAVATELAKAHGSENTALATLIDTTLAYTKAARDKEAADKSGASATTPTPKHCVSRTTCLSATCR